MSAMNGVCARSAPGQTVVTAGAGVYTRTHAETDAQPALRRQRRRYTQTTCIKCARTHTHTEADRRGQSQSEGGAGRRGRESSKTDTSSLPSTAPCLFPAPLGTAWKLQTVEKEGQGRKKRWKDRWVVIKDWGAGGHLFVTSTGLLQVRPLFSTALALLVLDLDAVLLLLLLFLLLFFLLFQVFLGALTLRGAFSGYGQGSLPQQGLLLLRQLLLRLLRVGGGLPWQLPCLGKDLEAEPGRPSAGRGAQPCSPKPQRVYSCPPLSLAATQPIRSFDVDRKRQSGDFPGAPVVKNPPANMEDHRFNPWSWN